MRAISDNPESTDRFRYQSILNTDGPSRLGAVKRTHERLISQKPHCLIFFEPVI